MRIIKHKNKIPLYDNNTILAWFDNPQPNRIVFTDADGFVYSTNDLVNWTTINTSPIYEETSSVYMSQRNRLYIITDAGYDDIYTDDGGLTIATTSNTIFTPSDPFYSPSLDKLIIPRDVTFTYFETRFAYSDDGGLTFNYSDKKTIKHGGRGAWSEDLGLFVYWSLDNKLVTSTNGIDWNVVGFIGLYTGDLQALYWFSDLQLFVGINGNQNDLYEVGVIYSSDGLNWTQNPLMELLSLPGNSYLYDICWNPDLSKLIISGMYNNDIIAISSPDAQNWTVSNPIAYGGSQPPIACEYIPNFGFVLVTTNGDIYQSTDLITFATYSTPPASSIRDVKWCGL